MSEKVSKGSEMRSGAAVMLRQVAEPKGKTKATIAFIARKLGWKQSRAKAIWYGEARRIDVPEMDALRGEYARLHNATKTYLAALEQANPHCSREELIADLRRIAALSHQDRA